MGGLINFLEFFDGVVGIDLGGGQRRMSQQFLYGIEVSPVVQQLCCKSVPEDMGRLFP